MRILYYRLIGARFVIDAFWPVNLPFGNGSGESSECSWIVPGTICVD
jgi:hypothetical protein